MTEDSEIMFIKYAILKIILNKNWTGLELFGKMFAWTPMTISL